MSTLSTGLWRLEDGALENLLMTPAPASGLNGLLVEDIHTFSEGSNGLLFRGERKPLPGVSKLILTAPSGALASWLACRWRPAEDAVMMLMSPGRVWAGAA